MVALTKLYFAGQRRRKKKAQRARDIADAPLRDYCERVKQELELQTGIKAQVEIPLTGQKNTQHKETIKSSLGAKGESVVPNTLLDAHMFSTPIRKFLQVPKTTGKKRKETDSSPTEETPGKIMRTGTIEQWKKVVPKNRRRKASPKHKTGTLPFNPKPIEPTPINLDNLNRYSDPKVPGTQGAIAPMGQNLSNLPNTLIKPPSAQKTTSVNN